MTKSCDRKWCEIGVVLLFILFAVYVVIDADDAVIYRKTHTEHAFMIDYDMKGMSDEYEVTFLCGRGFDGYTHRSGMRNRWADSLETLDADKEVISSLSLDKVYAVTFTHEWVLWGTPDKKLVSVRELRHEPHRQTYYDLYKVNLSHRIVGFTLLTILLLWFVLAWVQGTIDQVD